MPTFTLGMANIHLQSLVLKSADACQICACPVVVELTSPFNRNLGCVLCGPCAEKHHGEVYRAFGAAHPHCLPASALCHPNVEVSVVRSSGVTDPGWLPLSDTEYRALDPGTIAPVVFFNGEIKVLMRHVAAGHIRLCKAVDLLRVNPGWPVSLTPPPWANSTHEWAKQWAACVLAANNAA